MVADFIVDWMEDEIIQVVEAPREPIEENYCNVYVDEASNAKGIGVGIGIVIFNIEGRMIE